MYSPNNIHLKFNYSQLHIRLYIHPHPQITHCDKTGCLKSYLTVKKIVDI